MSAKVKDCKTCQFHKEFTHWRGSNSHKFKEPLIVRGLDPLISCTYKQIEKWKR